MSTLFPVGSRWSVTPDTKTEPARVYEVKRINGNDISMELVDGASHGASIGDAMCVEPNWFVHRGSLPATHFGAVRRVL